MSGQELWRSFAQGGGATALVDAASGQVYSYRELEARALALAERLAGRPRGGRERALVCVQAALDLGSIVAYLGALAAGHAVLLVDRQTPASLHDALCARYRPDFLVSSASDGVELEVILCPKADSPALHPELALLLSTSGTTGSPKLVRLSHGNLVANAKSIASYLELGPEERAISSLPIHYSYGLSVLNSHLLAGASLVVTGASLVRPEFWRTLREQSVTSLAGVPYAYQLMARIGFDQLALPSLRTLTQAGGRFSAAQVEHYQQLMAARGGRFFAMYGQTEATARISYLPPARALEKPGSIGVAIPGGSLHVMEGERELEPFAIGELVYRGPNVMLGYAHSAEELALGDAQQGVLRTGDLGYRDAEGFFYLTGRLTRFAKLYGLRINLDDIEERLRRHGPAAVVSDDERLYAFCESRELAHNEALQRELAATLALHMRSFRFEHLTELPRLASGKIDYDALQRRVR